MKELSSSANELKPQLETKADARMKDRDLNTESKG